MHLTESVQGLGFYALVPLKYSSTPHKLSCSQTYTHKSRCVSSLSLLKYKVQTKIEQRFNCLDFSRLDLGSVRQSKPGTACPQGPGKKCFHRSPGQWRLHPVTLIPRKSIESWWTNISMSIYIYIHTYIYIFIRIHICMCVSESAWLGLYFCPFSQMLLWIIALRTTCPNTRAPSLC